jgi:hypothetical protein
MNQDNYSDYEVIDGYSQVGSEVDVSAFMTKVFTYMTGALVLSGITAYLFGTQETLQQYLYTFENGIPQRNIFGTILMFAPLIFVVVMTVRLNKMSAGALLLSFAAFSILFGASISYIFLTYSMGHISQVFFISAGTFAVMAAVGYTTSTDLSKMGSILYMALIGLVIAMVVNFFMQSSMMSYIISGIGVLIFTGLTAYDTQKLKEIATTVGNHGENAQKAIIMGALNLYLDFINLFLFMLRFMGRD